MRLRLLVDLLQHEVLVAALLGLDRIPVETLHRAVDLRPRTVPDLDSARGEPREVAVLEEDDVAGVGEERRRIRGQELLALPESEQERRPLANRDDFLLVAHRRDRGEDVHPLKLVPRPIDRRSQVAARDRTTPDWPPPRYRCRTRTPNLRRSDVA